MSIGADILAALAARIATVTTAGGYAKTVKRVLVNNSQPTLTLSEADLPLVEVKDDAEVYEHEASSTYWANTLVCLFLVGPSSWSDGDFQDLMADIRRAIFGGGAAASGNTGLPLHARASLVELVDAASDLNMLSSNRTYLMRLRIRSLRTTYRD